MDSNINKPINNPANINPPPGRVQNLIKMWGGTKPTSRATNPKKLEGQGVRRMTDIGEQTFQQAKTPAGEHPPLTGRGSKPPPQTKGRLDVKELVKRFEPEIDKHTDKSPKQNVEHRTTAIAQGPLRQSAATFRRSSPSAGKTRTASAGIHRLTGRGSSPPKDEKPITAKPRAVSITSLDIDVLEDTFVQESREIPNFETREAALNELYKNPTLRLADAVGGHGGFQLAEFKEKGKLHQLFLKPYTEEDQVEIANYKAIQKNEGPLKGFMPTYYGETEIDGKKYMVMTNTAPKGSKALADLKLAGQVKGLFNPIARQKEHVATRGRAKSKLDYWQMRLGAKLAGGFMLATGKLRLLHYGASKTKLKEKLEDVAPEKRQQLAKDLGKIRNAMETDKNFAFIGASVLLIKDAKGNVTPTLIDPAHMGISGLPREEGDNLYQMEENAFLKQKQSNIKALDSMIKVISNMQPETPQA